jgi:glyoxylase-like metal-dependent hydrolase (beta-lactamase superfamily II)
MTFQLEILKMGECEVPGPEVYWMSNWNTRETLFFWMVLIKGGGKHILINTGPPSDLGPMNDVWSKAIDSRSQFLRREQERPAHALARIGVSPTDIDYVLITPLQAYATGNISMFPNATICISRRGWIEDFHAPKFDMHIPRRLRIPDDSLRYLVLEAPEKLRLLEDEDEILPGLHCFWTGVHHRSSIAYIIETVHGKVIASDCFFKYQNVENMIPLGIMESLEECMRAYHRIKRDADLLLPLYDPKALERLRPLFKNNDKSR